MHSSRAHEPLWLIGRESNYDSVLQGCAGGSTSSTSVWSRRSVDSTTHLNREENHLRKSALRRQPLRIERRIDFGIIIEVNEHVESRGSPLARAISFASRGRDAVPQRPYLHELELDIAFLNEVVLFA
jgi:hypothetical protein